MLITVVRIGLSWLRKAFPAAMFPLCALAYDGTDTMGGQGEVSREGGDGYGFYLEAGAGVEGYDSPVLVLDDGGAIEIGGNGRPTSPFFRTLVGVERGLPLGRGAEWVSGLELEIRRLPELTALDEDRLGVQTGIRWSLQPAGMEGGHLRLRVLGGRVEYDRGALRRNTVGMVADARLKPTRAETRSVRLEWRRHTHDSENDLLDAERQALTFGYGRGSPAGWAPWLAVRAGLANESNRWGEDDLSFRRAMLSAELTFQPSARWAGSVLVEARHARYREPEPGLDYRRLDRELTLVLGLSHELDKARQIECALEFSRLYSNDARYAGNSHVAGCAFKMDY